ncbi:MAG: hypothetical protein PVH54_05430 [Gammaproteobacteria bacterium]|jgi:hypothetical protein
MPGNAAARKREPDAMSGGGGWGCPHEVRGKCQRVKGRPCDPGMKGCILYGRFEFSNPEKNRPSRRDRTETRSTGKATEKE